MTQPIQEPSPARTTSGLEWGQSQIARRPSLGPGIDWVKAWFTTGQTVTSNATIWGSFLIPVWDDIAFGIGDGTFDGGGNFFDTGTGVIAAKANSILAISCWIQWTDTGYSDERGIAFAYGGGSDVATPNPIYRPEKLGFSFMNVSASPLFYYAQGSLQMLIAQTSGSNKTVDRGGIMAFLLGKHV